ncbi:MAG: hypothetical protein ACYTGW_06330 [Planctomycetota bacterium]|jgi:hypothetical protein
MPRAQTLRVAAAQIAPAYLDQAVELPGQELSTLQQAPADHRMWSTVGVVERQWQGPARFVD